MTGRRKKGGAAADGAAAAADSESAQHIEDGRRLFAQDCRFVTGALSLDAIPEGTLPEVAFAGRSNVGKSSLLNALTGRRTLARVSRTPGRTRQLNFFSLGERLMLADLPGYGYAEAGKREVAAWNRLIDAYLKGRAPLRRVCLLIDARLGPTARDRQVMDRLDTAAVSYQIVLTKADKIKEGALERLRARLAQELKTRPAAHPEIMVTSAWAGRGIAELRAELAALAR
ncbi:MAG TPA: ribosome biogenesis GTP-binding protein YihA/YsxC [Alphaproteobacteria bacterium]|jgi:GTP-binding protein|nr:ribosome biogenesis GTP-binding protein YihA/YsxC [Alphaproteobacteria bacterium]